MSTETVDYISLSLVVVCSVFFMLLYWWRKDFALGVLSMVFWFVSAMLWLITTSTPGTSLLFWGLGAIMMVYVVVDAMYMLSGKAKQEEDWEEEY